MVENQNTMKQDIQQPFAWLDCVLAAGGGKVGPWRDPQHIGVYVSQSRHAILCVARRPCQNCMG